MTRDQERANQLDEQLRHALEHQELRLEYQPKVDLAARTVVGFESLLYEVADRLQQSESICELVQGLRGVYQPNGRVTQ